MNDFDLIDDLPDAQSGAPTDQLISCVEQTAKALASVVDTVLAHQAQSDAMQQTLAKLSEDVVALRQRTEEVAASLATERAARDFAHASRIHPKSPAIVYASTFYLGDNVKYAYFDHRRRAAEDGITTWFLPQNAAQEQEMAAQGAAVLPADAARWSELHIAAALSTAVLVTSDHFIHPNPSAAPLLAGARHVQLWHGISIKEIGLRNLGRGRNLGPAFARVLATCGPFACLTGTAAAAEAEWRRWFRFDRYAAVGYPRNDVLYRTPTDEDLVNVDLAAFECALRAREAGRRVILYAPTFRDAKPGLWLQDAGLDAVAHAVGSRGDVLIVNVHPVEQRLMPMLLERFPNVLFIAPGSDTYPLLRLTSALVTDYSSLMFDYLHLDRPVVLYRPDDDEYRARSRTLFDDKLTDGLPGPVATDASALDRLLADPNFGQTEAHAARRHQLLHRLFDHQDGSSAARLWQVIRREVEHACR